jgi:glycosyltransferase involved in cell wall biosynthesis
MKIVIINPWFSEKMGYAENHLPRELGLLGHDVHFVTTDLQVYGTFSRMYNQVYRAHLGPPVVQQGIFTGESYTLHRLPHAKIGGLRIVGLKAKLEKLRPDIVYCFEIMDKNYETVVKERKKLGYRIFSESRMHASVFKAPTTSWSKLKLWIKARRSRRMAADVEKFYPIAPDVTDIITNYFGIPFEKCKISSLAVDTTLFNRLPQGDRRSKFRSMLGYADSDIVCLYTGRLTFDKGPHILAEAISLLASRGHSQFKAIFVGHGAPDYVEKISKSKHCQVHPLVQVNELPAFYNYLDIGIWPKQESTSQLDAAACGMPIIISNEVEDKIRVEGNGLTFENGAEGLAEQLSKLADVNLREALGESGCSKIQQQYSWAKLAAERNKDFGVSSL